MLLSNLELLGSEDTLKFVVSSRRDMEKALEILEKYRLVGKRQFISALFSAGSSRWRSWISLWKKAQRCKASDPAS